MDISSTQIEAIVRQVVASMGTGAAAKAPAGALPKVAKVAMLVDSKKSEYSPASQRVKSYKVAEGD